MGIFVSTLDNIYIYIYIHSKEIHNSQVIVDWYSLEDLSFAPINMNLTYLNSTFLYFDFVI